MLRLAVLVVSVFLLGGTTVACGQADSPTGHGRHSETVTASPGTSVPTGPVIAIEGMGFSAVGPVAPGTEITIINNDEVEHSVTSRTKDCSTSTSRARGGRRSRLPRMRGSTPSTVSITRRCWAP